MLSGQEKVTSSVGSRPFNGKRRRYSFYKTRNGTFAIDKGCRGNMIFGEYKVVCILRDRSMTFQLITSWSLVLGSTSIGSH